MQRLQFFQFYQQNLKEKLGPKEKMSYQLVDEFKIVGLQNYNLDEKLNPIEINIRDSEIQGKLLRYGTQHYKYHFIVDSSLISSSITQDTNVIFLICNRPNDARDSLINDKVYKSIGVISISETKDQIQLKGESKWINIIFNDSENPRLAKYFAYGSVPKNNEFTKSTAEIKQATQKIEEKNQKNKTINDYAK